MEKNKDKNSSFVKIFSHKDGTEFDIGINPLRSGINTLSDANGRFEKAYFAVSKLPKELHKYAGYNDFVSDIYARTEDGNTIAIIGANTSIEAVNVGSFAGCYIIRAEAKQEKIDDINEERVNHPKHYQHPSGIECITIARHHDFNIGNALKYIFRAGLKQEQWLTSTQKQIEDLQKAVFYIQDEIKFLQAKQKEQ